MMAIVLEGRDGAGKTTRARRLSREHGARIVRLPRPTEAELRGAYLERWVSHLPRAGEIVVFDRSWYTRALVEAPMGWCTAAELERFYEQVARFELGLVERGIVLVKIFLTIDDAEQARRIGRRADPSEVDRAALARPDDFRRASAEMLHRTTFPFAPWTIQ